MRMQAELNNTVRQQRAGAELNSTCFARIQAELNNTQWMNTKLNTKKSPSSSQELTGRMKLEQTASSPPTPAVLYQYSEMWDWGGHVTNMVGGRPLNK
jgi:hypothetical protein